MIPRISLGLLVAGAAAAQTGVPPRPAGADYAAHETLREVAVGAAIIPASQVAKVFTSRIAKDYVVIEVALYPKNASIDISNSDFALNWGDSRSYPSTTQEVAWHGQKTSQPSTTQGTHVVAEAGISFGTRTNPETGQTQHGTATYGAVGVDNRPSPSAPPPNPANDPDVVEGRLLRMALPEGRIDRPSAGYLYFPRAPKASGSMSGALRLEYTQDRERGELVLSTK